MHAGFPRACSTGTRGSWPRWNCGSTPGARAACRTRNDRSPPPRTAGPHAAGRADSHWWSSATRLRGAGDAGGGHRRPQTAARSGLLRHRMSPQLPTSPTSSRSRRATSSRTGELRLERPGPDEFAYGGRLPRGTFVDFSTSPRSTATSLPHEPDHTGPGAVVDVLPGSTPVIDTTPLAPRYRRGAGRPGTPVRAARAWRGARPIMAARPRTLRRAAGPSRRTRRPAHLRPGPPRPGGGGGRGAVVHDALRTGLAVTPGMP